MLTTTDVEQKTFSTALRGYDLDEVDDFLDEIVATLRELNDQLEEARGTAGRKEPEPVAAEPVAESVAEPEAVAEPEPEKEPAPTPRPAIDESAIGRALVAAHTTADQLLADAQAEAEKIVDDARGEADTWRVERDAKKAEAESEIAALAERVSSIRAELAVLAGEVAGKLDEMDAVIEGSEETTETEPETPTDDEASSETGVIEESSDELEEILNGVTADLQLDSGVAEEEGSGDDTGEETATEAGEEAEEET
ncbi:MAG: DivIVA domain-containing protein [Acidimicrobiia bacterium]